MLKKKTEKGKTNPLSDINWPQILSITANNLKIHKNAEEIHNIALKWSGLDASIKETEDLWNKLVKRNNLLWEDQEKVEADINKFEKYLADCKVKIKDKEAEIEKLDKVLNSDLAERKRILRVEFNKFKTEIDTKKKEMEDNRKELFLALDSQLEKKNRQIDDADVKIKRMADKLVGSL